MLDECNSKRVMQRARGTVDLAFEQGELQRMYQSGSAKVILPRAHANTPEAVLINTAGGITSDDVFSYRVSASAGSQLVTTTQTAERIYRADGPPATLSVDLSVDAGSQLHWMPQETILFDRSRLNRKLTARVGSGGELMIVEPIFFGRSAMGEALQEIHFTDTWRVYQDDKLVHAEATRLSGDVVKLMQGKSTVNGALAVATILFVAPDAEVRLEQARALLDRNNDADGVDAAASAWNGKLVVRFLAANAAAMRRELMQFLRGFRGCDCPRVWQM